MVPGQVGRDREEPGPDVGVGSQDPISPPGPEKCLLREVVRVAPAAGDPQEIALDLGVVGFQDGLERLLAHGDV
jgi:hypothetical protein